MKHRRCYCRYFVAVLFICSAVLLIIALLNTEWEINDDAIEYDVYSSWRHYIDVWDDNIDRRFTCRSQTLLHDEFHRHNQETHALKQGYFRNCRMSNCFNITMCRQNGFRVYVYPQDDNRTVSSKYGEILNALRSSVYYTDDPERACLFVLAIDTLDRDRLSPEYINDMQSQVEQLKWWRRGANHVVFNLYSGTWPDYNENGLGFDVGQAILAKASISRLHYRPGFDISFPLFHKELSYRGGEPSAQSSKSVPVVRKYLMSFKGKRYLSGIGSETRSSLYHIHNGQDIILLTTCKHGKGWKSMKDERCESDNLEYDKWDYKTLMLNSTFCLVPRGRRLGSYRFLESLQTACIPVLLSNDWVLPFSEVIDWNKATVFGDEQLLLQVPALVRSVNPNAVLSLRQQTQFLWETYFSSIEKIVGTTLEILKERVDQQSVRSSLIWNSEPGALAVQLEYSRSLESFPFYTRHLGISYNAEFSTKFTAVIYVSTPKMALSASSPVFRLMKNISRSSHLQKVVILCHQFECFPSNVRWPVKVPVVRKVIASVNERFMILDDIETDAIVSLDENVQVVSDELDFALSVWRSVPERLIGFNSRNHFWHDINQCWHYSSKSTNDYSMVLLSTAVYHRYYHYLYKTLLPQSLHDLVDELSTCEDILFNFLVTHVVHHPPVKLIQRRPLLNTRSFEIDRSFSEQHFCLNHFADEFGEMVLLRSSLRLDPLLYRDAVSILRKKYRMLETS